MKTVLVLVVTFLLQNVYAQKIIKESDYDLAKHSYLKMTLYNSAVGVPNGTWLHVKLPLSQRFLRGHRKHNHMNFRFYESKNKSDELIFLLTGLGSSVKVGYANFYARALSDNGYNVIVLPSIFTPEFLICLSDNGIVGEMAKDSEDYYELMIRAKKYMEENHNYRFGNTHVTGYSLGALTAGFIGKIDKREGKLNIQKNILINPPVDLVYGMKKIDEFVRAEERITALQYYKRFFKLAKNSITYRYYVVNDSHYENYMNRLQFSETTLKAIVGKYLSAILPSILKTAQDIVWFQERVPLLDPLLQISDYGYYDYLEKIVLKYRNVLQDEPVSIETLNDENSLKVVESYLRSSKDVYLFHNKDDFLIRDQDINYLKDVLKDRFTLYPYGGHLGNLWHPTNLKHIFDALK